MDLNHLPMVVKQELDRNDGTSYVAHLNQEDNLDHPEYVRMKSEYNESDDYVFSTHINKEIFIINNEEKKIETQLINGFEMNEKDRSADIAYALNLNRIKYEYRTVEYLDQCDLPTDINREADHIKNETKVKCKSEVFSDDSYMLLNEELEIKSEIDANSNETPEIVTNSAAKNAFWEHKHQVLNSVPTVNTSDCYDCKYSTCQKYNSPSHIAMQKDTKNNVCKSSKLEECIHCKAQFKRKVLLDDHITKHHPDFITSVTSKLHKCTKCSFKTTRKNSLTQHMLKHPETASSYEYHKCMHCNISFPSKAALDNHIIKNHPDYMASVTNKIHECSLCSFKTTFKHGMIKHMSKHPGAVTCSDMKNCVHCNTSFVSVSALENHIVRKHPNFMASVSSKVYECMKCNSFKTIMKSLLEKHMSECPKIIPSQICVHCNLAFKNKISLDDHIVKQHPNFITSVTRKLHECTKCAYKTTRKNCFDRHMLKHHETVRNYNYTMCVHCNGAFKSKTTLDQHIIKEHPKFIDSVTSKLYKCEACNFKSTNKAEFTRHLSKHTGIAPSYKPSICVQCMHCTKDFRSKKCLDDHILKMHPNFIESVTSKVHMCTNCSYKTTLRNHLERHLLKHSKCTYCNMSFTSKLTLDDHIIEKHPDFIVTSVNSRIYDCIKCTYKTTMKHNLTQHVLKHHEVSRSNKLSVCIHCDEAFRTKKALEEHVIRKHPEFAASVNCKLHQCPKCAYKTTRANSFARHMLIHPETASGYRFSTCLYCDELFRSKINLHYHILKKHPSHIGSITSKIHECGKCTFKTTHRNQLVEHMFKHTDVAAV